MELNAQIPISESGDSGGRVSSYEADNIPSKGASDPITCDETEDGDYTTLKDSVKDTLCGPAFEVNLVDVVCQLINPKRIIKEWLYTRTVKHLSLWWRGNAVPQSVISLSQSVLNSVDALDDCDTKSVRRRDHDIAIAVEAADFAKSEKFFKVRSVANEAIVHRLIRGYLIERHVRHKDMARVLPIAVTLAFTPNESEIFANQLAATPLFIARVKDLNREWYSREESWLGNWFGRKVKPPPIQQA